MTTAVASVPANAIFRVEVSEGIATVLMDVPGEPVNTLSPEVGAQLDGILSELDRDERVRGVVFGSGKREGFIAGAKIDMLQGVRTAEEAQGLSRGIQKLFERLAALRKPVVAAIHGACLGGGMELALACRFRVVSDDRKTQLGLPEVQLGLIPGAGGTQRLPRLVGLVNALDLILSGRSLRARKARSMGLADEVVPAPILLAVAARRARELADGVNPLLKRKVGLKEVALEENRLGREVLFRQAHAKLMKRTRGHYPAPEKALEVIKVGALKGMEAGLAAEAQAFGELAVGDVARRLMEIFFAQTAIKKESGVDGAVQPRPVRKVGIVGGGFMGGGIAFLTLDADIQVRLRDRDDVGVGRGMAHVRGLLDERAQRRSITALERDQKMRLLTGGTGWAGFKRADLVIEAVFEDLALKQEVVRGLEGVNPEAIFASNTSTLPIAKIAEAAKRPEQVLGMHYFSPAHKMPLLEVIITPRTAPEVIATAVALGKKQGKTPIVVKDSVGFYVNRILAPYLEEATRVLEEGGAIEEIDRALLAFGFPVGPLALIDEVGMEVAAKAARIIHQAFAPRIGPPELLDRMRADDRAGRKNGRGFYKYQGKKKEADAAVYAMAGAKARVKLDPAEVAERTALRMVAEAIRCLEEGIIRSPRDGDIGALFGLGFPPFRGGPFRYADALGAQKLRDSLERLREKHGERFAPPASLLDARRHYP
jgi:3-hydroxyacyl-CoA dehydrogenase/enoyl-CoA hydratase/3-hydroxybutyryl-CoA epimerase